MVSILVCAYKKSEPFFTVLTSSNMAWLDIGVVNQTFDDELEGVNIAEIQTLLEDVSSDLSLQ